MQLNSEFKENEDVCMCIWGRQKNKDTKKFLWAKYRHQETATMKY